MCCWGKLSTRGPRSLSGSQLVNVKLDGVFLGDDLLPLTGLLTSDFEVIMVNLNGAGEGIRGSNGVVNLILRTDVEYIRKNNPTKTVVFGGNLIVLCFVVLFLFIIQDVVVP